MVKLTDMLGKNVWNNAIFVLTCANKLITTIKSTIPKCDADITEQVKDEYHKKLDSWKLHIKHVLQENLKLHATTIENLPIVPIGRKGLPLFVQGSNLFALAKQLVDGQPLHNETNAQPALIKMNQKLLKKALDIRSEKEFEELPSKETMVKGSSIGREMKAEREGRIVGMISGFKTGLAHLLEHLFMRNNPLISDISITCDQEETRQAIDQFVQDHNNS